MQESGGGAAVGTRQVKISRQEEPVPFVLRTQEDFKR